MVPHVQARVEEESIVKHGTPHGYSNLKCRCGDCRAAKWRYEKRRKFELHNGRTLTVPVLGFRRRVHALACIGYPQAEIARELGIAKGNLSKKMWHASTVTRAMHRQMAALYKRLSGTPATGPLANRTATLARAKGWAPPAAWNCIDTDAAPHTGRDVQNHDECDPVVVERFFGGEHTIPTTRAEKETITQEWKSRGKSYASLEDATGWRTDRYKVSA